MGWTRGGAPLTLKSAKDGLLERDPVLLVPVGSGRSLRTSISSISSIEGNVCAKSCRLRTDMRGEEEVDEDGEGGPRLDVGTSAWAEGAGGLLRVGEPRLWWKEEGENAGGESACRDKRLGRTMSGDSGGDPMGISREMRFVVATDRPALCRERMRSAMLPPPVLTIGLLGSSSLGVGLGIWVQQLQTNVSESIPSRSN